VTQSRVKTPAEQGFVESQIRSEPATPPPGPGAALRYIRESLSPIIGPTENQRLAEDMANAQFARQFPQIAAQAPLRPNTMLTEGAIPALSHPILPEITAPGYDVMGTAGAAAYNTLVRPLSSPLSALTLGLASPVQEVPAIGRLISGGFAADMGRAAIEGVAPALRTISDPNASAQQKIEAGLGEVANVGLASMAGIHALDARLAGKTPEQASKAIREEVKATEDKATADALTDAADALDREISAQEAQAKAQAGASKLAEQQTKAVAEAQAAQQEAAQPPEVPKSEQILAEASKPPALANVATEIGTQTSPFALQEKLTQLTAPVAPEVPKSTQIIDDVNAPKSLANAAAIGAKNAEGNLTQLQAQVNEVAVTAPKLVEPETAPSITVKPLVEGAPALPFAGRVPAADLESAGGFKIPTPPESPVNIGPRDASVSDGSGVPTAKEKSILAEQKRLIDEHLKTTGEQQNAIPEQSPGALPIRNASENSQGVREPNPVDQGAAGTQNANRPREQTQGQPENQPLVATAESRLNNAGIDLPPITSMSRAAKRAELDSAGITTYNGKPIDEANPAEISSAVGKLRRGQLTPEGETIRTSDKIIAALEKAKIRKPGKAYAAVEPFSVAYDLAIDTAISAIRAGRSVAEAIQTAIAKFREMHAGATDEQVARLTEDITKARGENAPEPFPQPVSSGGSEARGQSASSLLDYDTAAKGTDAQKQSFADAFVTHHQNTPDLAISEMRQIPDPAFRQVVASRLLAEEFKRSASGSVAEKAMTEDRINRLITDIGQGKAQAGQNLQAESLVNKNLEAYRPELALRGALKRTLDTATAAVPEGTAEKINAGFKQAGNVAAEDLGADAKAANALLRGPLKRIQEKSGINWRDIFTDLPENIEARKAEIFNRLKTDPKLANLPEATKQKLADAMERAWESIRNDVFRREFATLVDLPNIPKPDAEKLTRSIPKIIEQANLGLLDNDAFRNALADQYGVRGLDAETGRKLRELGQKALRTPEGVERNAVSQEILDTLLKAKGVDPRALLNDYWFRNVMSDPSTGLGIGVGGVINGATRTLTTAIDVALREGKPGLALQLTWLFLKDATAGVGLAADILVTGDRTLSPRFNQRFMDTLDRLEKGQPPGGEIAALYKNATGLRKAALFPYEMLGRGLEGLDYIGSQGILQQQAIYAALKRENRTAFDASMRVFDREQSDRAAQQARTELGADARWAKVRARSREILNQGISEGIIKWRNQASELNALNSKPLGISGQIYDAFGRVPGFRELWSKPLGAAFLKAGLNLFQESTNWAPGTGQINALRAWKGDLRELPAEQRGHINNAQYLGLGLMASAAALFLSQSEEDAKGKPRKWEISGPWRGFTPAEKRLRMDAGEQSYTIRMPSGRLISYKNTPFVGALAMIGHVRDQERFNGVKWSDEGKAQQVMNAWLGGQGAVMDLSVAQQFGTLASALTGLDKEPDETKVQRAIAASAGSAAAGLIPFSSLARAADNFLDQQRYQPNRNIGVESWLRQVPFVRRDIGVGPMLNFLGDPVQVPSGPERRFTQAPLADDPIVKALSDKVAVGMTPPPVSQNRMIVDSTGDKKPAARKMTPEEAYAYEKNVRQYFKRQLTNDLPAFVSASPEQAQLYANKVFERGERYAIDRMGSDVPFMGQIPIAKDMTQALTDDYAKIKAMDSSEAAPSALAQSRLRVAFDNIMAVPEDQRNTELRKVVRTDPEFGMKLVDYVLSPANQRTVLEKAEAGLEAESRAEYYADKMKGMSKQQANDFLKQQFSANLLTMPVLEELAKRKAR
jgi:hypothetical protein